MKGDLPKQTFLGTARPALRYLLNEAKPWKINIFTEILTLHVIIFLGSFDIVHVKDNTGHQFATRISNIFIIGKTNKSHVSLPKGKGVRLTIAEERDRRLQEKAKMSSM